MGGTGKHGAFQVGMFGNVKEAKLLFYPDAGILFGIW